MSDLNLAKCAISKHYNPKILSIPSSCSVNRSLQYSDNHSNYKGPFLNLSFSSVPLSDIIIKPLQSLSELSYEDIPDEWSWRKQGGDKIENGRRNQGKCGCCWAIAFVSALGDRYAIKYNIKAPYPSAMWMISCGGTQIGSKGLNGSFAANRQCLCGGSIYGAAKWLEEGNSIGTESCWPYSTVSNNPVDTQLIAPNCPNVSDDCCFDCCGNPESKIKFSVEKGSVKPIIVSNDGNTPNPDATIHSIKLDIMKNGPVATTFLVPKDFQEWWISRNEQDIYTPTPYNVKNYDGGHAVVLTGWGNQNGQNYWEMRNSWGFPGYCRFRMSTDLEQDCWTGIDIAIFSDDSLIGGPVSVMPGKLSDDPNHGKKQPDDPDHGKKQPDDPDHGKKQPDDPDHGKKQPDDPDHGKKQPDDPDHGKKQPDDPDDPDDPDYGKKEINEASSLFKKINWKIIGIIGIVIFIILIISFLF